MDEPGPSPQDEQKAQDRLQKLHAEYRPKDAQRSSVVAFGTAGIELGLAVMILTLGGWWLDKKFGTSPALLLVGAAVGITGGMYRMFRTFNQLMK